MEVLGITKNTIVRFAISIILSIMCFIFAICFIKFKFISIPLIILGFALVILNVVLIFSMLDYFFYFKKNEELANLNPENYHKFTTQESKLMFKHGFILTKEGQFVMPGKKFNIEKEVQNTDELDKYLNGEKDIYNGV
jgi:hypothetical protein